MHKKWHVMRGRVLAFCGGDTGNLHGDVCLENTMDQKFFRYLKWRGTPNEPYLWLFWGVGFPLHKPYPYSLYR